MSLLKYSISWETKEAMVPCVPTCTGDDISAAICVREWCGFMAAFCGVGLLVAIDSFLSWRGNAVGHSLSH